MVDLWVNYAHWMETCAEKTNDTATKINEKSGERELKVTDKDVRDVYEQAISACAHHVGQGLRVWLAYIAYVTRTCPSDTSSLRSLYKRALSLPYVGLEQMWDQFKEWEQQTLSSSSPPQNTESLEPLYRKSLAELEERLPFENKISDNLDGI